MSVVVHDGHLEVRLDGELLATLEDRGMGLVALSFSDQAFARYGRGARVLSLALPVEADVPVERSTQFWRGLLPEGPALGRVAQQLRLSTNDAFGLLRELGRDCAGALVIVPPGEDRRLQPAIEWLDERGLANWIDSLPTNPLGLDRDGEVRLSLAGVQDKLVVCVDPDTGAIGKPLHGTPSTHVLKPPSFRVEGVGPPRTPSIVANEAFCMQLARTVGLAVARVDVRRVAGEHSLLVERYDRRRDGDRVLRIHQEDACQALAIDPLHKYEANGGPSLASVGQLVRSFAAEPLRDLYRLLDVTVLNVVIGNLDAHGKNVSFVHEGDEVSLAPAYDLVAVAAYPTFARGTLAMRIGGAERLDEVDAAAIDAAYAECGLRESVARRRVPVLLETIERALPPTLDAARAEGWHTSLLDDIAGHARRRIEALRA